MEPDDKCRARRRAGRGYCGREAGWGTDHLGEGRCKLHGGTLPAHRVHLEGQRAIAAVRTFGLAQNVEPQQALLDELSRTHAIVGFWEGKVQELEDDQLVGPIGGQGVNEAGVEFHPRSEAHIYVRLHQQEREHLIRVAKACVDAGIAERQIELAEQQGALLALAVKSILADLGLDPADPKVRKVVRSRLLEAGQSTNGHGEVVGPKAGGG